jgi:hypothetical protein
MSGTMLLAGGCVGQSAPVSGAPPPGSLAPWFVRAWFVGVAGCHDERGEL